MKYVTLLVLSIAVFLDDRVHQLYQFCFWMIEYTNCINSVSLLSAMFDHVFMLSCVRELTLLVLFIIHKNYSAVLHANYNKFTTKYYQQIQEVLL